MAYLGLMKYAKETAYDNGGINRARSEKQMEREANRFFDRVSGEYDLGAIDAWILSLSDDDLHEVCCGEETDQQRILEPSPPFTWKFMCQYFDEVC